MFDILIALIKHTIQANLREVVWYRDKKTKQIKQRYVQLVVLPNPKTKITCDPKVKHKTAGR